MVYGIDREEMCRKIDEKKGTYNSILINLNGYIVKSEHEMRLQRLQTACQGAYVYMPIFT